MVSGRTVEQLACIFIEAVSKKFQKFREMLAVKDNNMVIRGLLEYVMPILFGHPFLPKIG